MLKIIDKTYLPFKEEDLRSHFVADADGHLAYYQKSAKRHHEFPDRHQSTTGIPIEQSRFARQIEKDERFWTITAPTWFILWIPTSK